MFTVIGSISSLSLTPQLLATCFSSHFSSEADPSKATSNLSVGKFNDLLFGLHLGQLSAHFGISASYFPSISYSSGSQDVPFSVSLILILCLPSPAFDSSSSLNPLHDILQSPILGLFLSFNFPYFKISAFTSSWVVNA